MIHSPTKAENKVMVAIKEVNENELPENGTIPSVCLHVSSVSEDITKNAAVLLDFVQIRGDGGGPCPNFLSHFHKCIFGQ